MRPIAALYVRKDSIYKTMPDVDCYDAERDARLWPGGMPVVAHPPCAQWGILRGLANRNLPVKSLAVLAVLAVRRNGGVLEHPFNSTLWKHCRLPRPNEPADKWGGYTISVLQQWWGHLAAKSTWIYIVGVKPADLPPIPFVMGKSTGHVGGSVCRRPGKQQEEIPKSAREHTPPAFAEWLVATARLAVC